MKKIGIVAVLSVLVGVFSVGCGNSGGSASCDLKTATSHICTSYDFSADTTGLLASAEASACTQSKGTSGDCPAANALGTCVQGAAGAQTTITYYSDSTPALTADQAKTACGAGTWTAK